MILVFSPDLSLCSRDFISGWPWLDQCLREGLQRLEGVGEVVFGSSELGLSPLARSDRPAEP